MTAQLTTPIRRNRAAIVAGVAALIGGGYEATTTIGPDAHPAAAAGAEIAPSHHAMRELDQTIRDLYGPQPSSNTATARP